jgi:hypothetical protein
MSDALVCANLNAISSVEVLSQVNASPYGVRSTLVDFQTAEIQTQRWPASSPDLNPVETVWAMLVRRLTADARRYNNEDEF